MPSSTSPATYSYLGPAGTFTWAALKQVPEAAGQTWRSVNNVGEALDDVVSGRSAGAVIAIENSVEGGVSATQDALANIPGLRITGEYLVPVDFVLVARPSRTCGWWPRVRSPMRSATSGSTPGCRTTSTCPRPATCPRPLSCSTT